MLPCSVKLPDHTDSHPFAMDATPPTGIDDTSRQTLYGDFAVAA